MPRIRSIKPGFWSNDILAECSRDARLLWIGMWNLADRNGNLKAKPARLRAEVFPFDQLTSEQVEGWLVELETRGFLKRYVVDGDEYAEIPNFGKHQKLHREEPEYHPKRDAPGAEKLTRTLLAPTSPPTCTLPEAYSHPTSTLLAPMSAPKSLVSGLLSLGLVSGDESLGLVSGAGGPTLDPARSPPPPTQVAPHPPQGAPIPVPPTTGIGTTEAKHPAAEPTPRPPTPGSNPESGPPKLASTPPIEPPPPEETFGRGFRKPHDERERRPIGPRDAAAQLWCEAFKRNTGRPANRNDAAMLDLGKLAEDPDHGPEEIRLRLGYFEAHYKAKSFGADAFALGPFVRHWDRWAKPPAALDPKGKPVLTLEESAAATKALLDKYGIGDDAPGKLQQALPAAEGEANEDG